MTTVEESVQTKHIADVFSEIKNELTELSRRIGELEQQEQQVQTLSLHSDSISSPPTLLQIQTAFGAAGSVGVGFSGVMTDLGLNVSYLVWSDGTNWWSVAGTKAV